MWALISSHALQEINLVILILTPFNVHHDYEKQRENNRYLSLCPERGFLSINCLA